jgi:hypothetical protein
VKPSIAEIREAHTMKKETSSTSYRIVRRPAGDGLVFRVQQEQPAGSNRWWTIDGFDNVAAARKGYPLANSDLFLNTPAQDETPAGGQS